MESLKDLISQEKILTFFNLNSQLLFGTSLNKKLKHICCKSYQIKQILISKLIMIQLHSIWIGLTKWLVLVQKGSSKIELRLLSQKVIPINTRSIWMEKKTILQLLHQFRSFKTCLIIILSSLVIVMKERGLERFMKLVCIKAYGHL